MAFAHPEYLVETDCRSLGPAVRTMEMRNR
jgi:hypothetical protein